MPASISCVRPGMQIRAGRGLRSAQVFTLGNVWFGTVGDGGHTELTIVGDVVNVAARLAAQAAAGEVLISTDAATAAGVVAASPHRFLELKGKQDPFEVVTLKVDPSAGA